MQLSKKTLAAAVSAALLVGAPGASAATSAQTGYSTPGSSVQTQIESSTSPSTTGTSDEAATQTTKAKASGSLPFTGLDLALVVAAGGILLALGLGMRRIARQTTIA